MRLGPFRLLERAGAGGMGEVWRATHVASGEQVAVKRLLGGRATPEMERQFQTEVRAVAAMSHPHIVRVVDSGAWEGPWLAMEWADGVLEGVSDWPALLQVLRDVLSGLAHAHARGVRHLDVKPANVLWAQGRWKLADFGIARIEEQGRQQRVARGTPRYMAPEQFTGRDEGAATDLFSVGRMAEALASGFPVPQGLGAWVGWLTAPDPRDRCGHAADARAALDTLGQPTVSALPAFTPGGASETWVFGAEPVTAAAPAQTLEPRPAPPPQGWPAVPAPPPALAATGLGVYALRPVPLVDRVNERAGLWRELAQATSGRRLVLLDGPSGRGKTRLARELALLAAEHGAAHVLSLVHSQQAGPATGLGPALARQLGLVGAEPASAEAWLAPRVERPIDAQWLVDEMLRRGGGQPRARRHGAVLRWLRRSDRPWVLHIDDVQWADEALTFVEELPEDLPVLVVLTARSEAMTEPIAERLDALPLTRLSLGPLPTGDHAELVQHLLGLEGPLAERIRQRTDGNPLFAVQLVGDWVQRGILVAGEGGFRLEDDARDDLPDSLAAVWRARVRQLVRDPEQRQALELAALLGQQVDDAEWAAAAGRPVDSLREQLLQQRLAEPLDRGWAFAHGMLRETLLLDIDDPAPLHARCAEAVSGDNADAWRRRARHREGHQALDLARKAWRETTFRAEQQGDPRGALAAVTRLLELGPTGEEYWGAIVSRAGVYKTSGRTLDAEAEAQKVLDGAPAGSEALGRAHAILGDTHLSRRDLATARHHFERAMANSTDPYRREWVRQSLSTTLIAEGRTDEADVELERILTSGHARGVLFVDTTRTRAYIAGVRGDTDLAQQHLRSARDYALEHELALGHGLATQELADLLTRTGQVDEALREYDAARTSLAIYGRTWLDVWDVRRAPALVQRDPAAAYSACKAALPSLRQRGRWEVGVAQLCMAQATDVDEARQLLEVWAKDLDKHRTMAEQVGWLLRRVAVLHPDLADRVEQLETQLTSGTGPS